MKYSEFEREVEREGFNVDRKSGTVYVDSTTGTVMSISTDDLFMFDCDWSAFVHLNRDVQEPLFDLAYQLAKTPLAEREEEKKYWLQKITVPLLDKEGEKKWLWKYTGTARSNVFGADIIKVDSKLYQTIFTESEIAEMDIAGFEKVEVEE